MNNSRTIKVRIDGKEFETLPGNTILQVANENGIDIPTLCYDSRLNPYGSCLLCVVEVEGMPKLALSCATEVRDNMKVLTKNERIFRARKSALDMLLSNHFADCRGLCYEKCPACVDVQGYLALANAGKYRESLDLIRKTNPLPLICGRVCVRYCEANCRRNNVDSAVGVNYIKRYVADLEYDNLPSPVTSPPNGHKVAIVGGGPAGLSAAYYLALEGYKPTVFEAQPQLGGMLRWGIPDYRLPPEVITKEINYILQHGISVKTNVRLGIDFTIDDLKSQGFGAVYLALGAWKAKKMGVTNEDTPGVVGGIHFLAEVKKKGTFDLTGHVLVVGGGNTAVDAARTAIRCRAAKVSPMDGVDTRNTPGWRAFSGVTILYRRTREEMPADDMEIEDALAEGVEIKFLVAPLEVVVQNGRVKGLICQEMKLGEPDRSGRRRPIPIPGSEKEIPCSHIIAAIGQDCDLSGVGQTEQGEIKISKWNTILVDEKTYASNVPGVFAGGDVVTGPAAAIDAVGAGRKAAIVIDRYLKDGVIAPPASEFLSKKENLDAMSPSHYEKYKKIERVKIRQNDAETRIESFDEVDLGVTAADAAVETSRCLSCGCSAVFNCELKKYAGEYQVDQKKYHGRVKKYPVDDRHSYITLEPGKCILCGKCVRLCSELIGVSALGFVNRGFETIVRPSLEKPLQNTTCISCGNCIEACPTGAIDFHMPLDKPGPWMTTPYQSVCNHCGVGCRVVFNKKADDLWFVTAGTKKEKPSTHVNSSSGGEHLGQICFRGRFGHEFLLDKKRIGKAVIREDKRCKTVDTRRAIEAAMEGLKKTAEKHGSESLAFFVSPKASNEEMFLVQKIARQVFGVNNVACAWDMANPGDREELNESFGLSASTLPQKHLESTDIIVVVNTDVDEQNPVLGFDIRQGIRRGAKLVVISPIGTRLADAADLWIQPAEGSQTAFLEGLAGEIYRMGAFDDRALAEKADNIEAFFKKAKAFVERACETTGISAQKITRLAQTIADPKNNVVFVYGADIPQEKAPGALNAIADILLLTGKIGKERNGLILPHIHNNFQGYLDLFIYPEGLENKAVAAQTRKLSGAHSILEYKKLMTEGKIRGMFVLGEDILKAGDLAKGLKNLDFLVAMDVLETETTKEADVVIPASSLSESEGSVTSHDRKVQAFIRAFDPPSGQTGFHILSEFYARALDIKTPSIEEIRFEIAKLNPRYRKIGDIGQNGSFYWSDCEEESEILFSRGFSTKTKKAMFVIGKTKTTKSHKSVPTTFSSIEQYLERQIKQLHKIHKTK